MLHAYIVYVSTGGVSRCLTTSRQSNASHLQDHKKCINYIMGTSELGTRVLSLLGPPNSHTHISDTMYVYRSTVRVYESRFCQTHLIHTHTMYISVHVYTHSPCIPPIQGTPLTTPLIYMYIQRYGVGLTNMFLGSHIHKNLLG